MKPSRGKTPKKPPRKAQNKDPVEVYCRLRPISDDLDSCVTIVNSNTIQLKPPEISLAVKNGNYKETKHTFKFVFPEQISQKALFDHVALPLVDDLLHGKNALLFMYGITSSGKTYTMQGTPGDGGILPRCLDVLFNSLGDLQARKYVFKPDRANGFDVQTEADAMMERQKKELLAPPPTPKSTPKTPRRKPPQNDIATMVRVPDTNRISTVDEDNNYSVYVSYIEIYNNYIYDLLEDTQSDGISQKQWQTPKSRDDNAISLQSKTLREDSNHNMYVANCTEIEAKNTEEAYGVFMKGQRRRKVAHTQLNTESSRSHSVFNIRLVQAPLDPVGEEVLQDKEQVCVAQLSLVDLAGSERTGRTQNSGDRLREAGNINASLMTLRTCIEVLRENQMSNTNKIVPYRDSKVTHLFKNYFDGEGKVRMVVCVNPQAADYDETTHVMRFAEVTQEVQVARPTAIKFDIGLTPGRRRANQIYKKMLEDGADLENLPIQTPVIINLGPAFPCLEVNDPNEDSILQNLITFLAEREKRRHTLQEELTRKQGAFRARLMEMEREMETLKQQNSELNMKVSSKDKNTQRFEKRIRDLEQENEMMKKTQTAYEYSQRELETELREEKSKTQKQKHEQDRLRQALKGVAGSEKVKWEKECEKRVRATQMEMQTKIWVKDEKLRQLKQIVCAQQEREDKARKAKADLNRTRSPPPKTTQPPVKLRHRRSRSTSNAWIDHKPATTLETETVLQPAGLKKKHTVAVPTVKDLKGTDNYMLTHQEEDSKGELETKLYKAEVLQTRGGGRAVQFTDIEKLKTERPASTSPKDRKRPAEEELESGEWTDVETRCTVGYEGRPGNVEPAAVHIVPSKKMKK
ncbi:kinesin-like protein KIF23 isoform X2 [Acanthaster planci]|uniref:Kinesin-like protein n=1 Tax=Acanthaster planci TaxID=133434 RepID=A0A8B7ZSQ2_ACAPL|nr:kinesin-like protein KIF23 isoform X2 [Acanthaster planci]